VAEALRAAGGIEDPGERATTLAALAAALPEGERGPVLAEAHAAADAVKYAFQRVEALATVAFVPARGEPGAGPRGRFQCGGLPGNRVD
jgi:hypothetical protein